MPERGPEQRDVLRPTDDEARRLAATLLLEARHAALAVLEPGTGVPLSSRIALASDVDGAPVFLISQLSAHFGALEADPRSSILVGEPGRGDPLAHPRMTVIGRASRIRDDAERQRVRARFLGRHPKSALYVDFGDFAFWRLEIERASLNGGFGKAYELAATDLVERDPAVAAALAEVEAGAVEHMNDDHLDAVALYATKLLGEPEAGAGAWRVASLDCDGLDLFSGERVRRLWFEPPLESASALRPRLVDLAARARAA